MPITDTQIFSDPLGKCWPTSGRNTPSRLGEAVPSLSDVGEVGQQGVPYWPQLVLYVLDQFLITQPCGVCCRVKFGESKS